MTDTTLARRPAIDDVDERTLDLVRKTVAENTSNAELGLFLQICQTYDLDPFAKEAWCAVSKARDGGSRRLLIMVGRDGLRKIAARNHLRIDGDVVRQRDQFKISRRGDRSRAIEHSYEESTSADATPGSSRGAIIGAWAEVWDESGTQRGWFYAPMHEYRPTSEAKLRSSPWGTQESVMILAAAERQALRQATPLSGLLVEGEMDLNDERARGVVENHDTLSHAIIAAMPNPRIATEAEQLIETMNGLAPGSWTASKVQMVFQNMDMDTVVRELEHISSEIEDLRNTNEAEVVPDHPDPDKAHRLARIAELEEVLADKDMDLTDQARHDIEAELDMLTNPPE